MRMRIAELRSPTMHTYPGYNLATYYVALGEKDEAFAALNKAYENHEFGMILLKVDPRLDPLRDDQRFKDLLSRVGFSQ